MTYAERLQKRIDETGSRLCVGLDPRPDLHDSVAAIGDFCRQVIAETADRAAVFKPNIAYFEALGVEGYQLIETLPNAAISGRLRTTMPRDISETGTSMPLP